MTAATGPVRPSPSGDGVRILLKVVPGASRTQFAGLHGDRYRLRVAAPPEGGKANEAAVAFLADRLGVRRRDVFLARGTTSPLKTVEVRGLSPAEAAARIEDDSPPR